MTARARWRSEIRRPCRRLGLGFAVGAVALAGCLGFWFEEKAGLEQLRMESGRKVDGLAGAVDSVITRHAAIPVAVQVSEPVLHLLRSVQVASPSIVAEANRFLQGLNDHLGGPALFVLDVSGRVIASSDWIYSTNLLGQDLSYMPFFRAAVEGIPARHYAVDPVRPDPGYFIAQPIRDEGQGWRVIGVAVVKTSLHEIERRLQSLGTPALVVDSNRVVLVASPAEWRYGTLDPLNGGLPTHVDPRPYAGPAQPFRRLGFPDSLGEDEGVVRIPAEAHAKAMPFADQDAFLALSRKLPETGWRVIVFAGVREVRIQALVVAVLAGAATACLVLISAIAVQQKRLALSRERARRLTLRSNKELERLVEDRTAELRAAVAQQTSEVAERRRAEQTLREAQDELVQSAKLAVIGKLAAGVTHELAQPLSAIRALSENAISYMNADRLGVAQQNLELIARLVEQMGQIIHPLKCFGRKSPAVRECIDVAAVVESALLLFYPRLDRMSVQIDRRIAPETWFACADANRLQQVIVNVVGNALDAMSAVSERRLGFEVRARPDAIELSVQDSGPGVSEDVRARLFEPFFTTKRAGEGLGLGLAISRDILRDFDGDLRVDPGHGCGARFVIVLPLSRVSRHAA